MSGDNRNSLPIGSELEGYRIEGVLGAGGFGITYLGIEVETGRRVAIKEYLPSGLAQRGERDLTVRPISGSHSDGYALGLERFREEARTLVQFRHPNIVWTLRFFQALGTAYLVMDYIEGESLAGVLSRAVTLSEGELEPLIYPLLDGLKAVHEAGFLHRDVKPDNIYIRRDTGQPVLLDFGAARQALGQATHTLTVIVSHGYAPFEQYTSKGEHGPWTDVYGLGATLYRCISGERPPAAPDRVDAIFAGKSDPLVPARELGQGKYSAPFLEAIDRALRPQPSERPQSVTAFKAILEGRSSQAAPATQQIGRSARRDEPMTLITPPPGTSGSSSRSSPATLQASPVLSPTVKVETPARRSTSRSKITAVLVPVLLLLLGGGGYYGYSEWQSQRERESAETVRRQVEEHVGKARAAMRQGDFTEAERQLDAAAKLDRASASVSDARKTLADAIRQRADAAERRRRALERVERARDALKRNEHAQAEQAVAEAEQIDPAATNYSTLKREIAAARQRAEDERRRKQEEVDTKKRARDDTSRRDEKKKLPASLESSAPGTVFRDCPGCPEMVVIPGGSFVIGSQLHESERSTVEGPLKTVQLRKFALAKYSVTFEEWDACSDAGACAYRPPDQGWERQRRPVINVAWEDATNYIAWLNRKTGKHYRLPSEAEREYATRAGTTTTFYTGNSISTDVANYNGNFVYGPGVQGLFRERTMPVGSFPPNPFGLHDMHGNVWEWTNDCWNEDYSLLPLDGSSRLVGDCSRRTLRGGAWFNSPHLLRSATRHNERLRADPRSC